MFSDLQTRKLFRNTIALIWVAFQIYACFKAGISTIGLRGIHIGFAVSIVFLSKPLLKSDPAIGKIIDFLCAILALICGAFLYFDSARIMSRMLYITEMTMIDLVLGGIFIVLLIETCRRMLGLSMTIVCLVFVIYGFIGKILPGILAHRGMNISSMIELQFVSTNGIIGTASGVSADTVFYFMIFGSFLSATPAGKLFISLAKYITRKMVGGEAKSMVVACGLFGMISGSAAANVASVGTLTYDSVVESGFKPKFTAAILAIAGAGGQIIPPVMGAAAFLMADYVGISYFTIVLYAIIPAFLYILSLVFIVHYQAKKFDIKSKPVDTTKLKEMIIKYFYLLIPLVLLVYLIANGKTVRLASTYSIIALLILTTVRKDSRMNLRQMVDTLIDGANSAVVVAIPCAVAGVIVGILSYTSLGLTISQEISKMAGNRLWLALILAMILVIIMGMGMPTSAAYIMSATLLAPALKKIGVPLIVAHFFIFYFANLSMITPPVALAAYTAAGVAKTPFWETGIEAFKYSFIIFLIPFVFVYNPALLGLGTVMEIALAVIPAVVGLWAVAVGMIGFFKTNISIIMRILLVGIGFSMIVPENISTIIGIACSVVFIIYQFIVAKAAKTA
ncbi:MAG: TRAP transporter fused permease subunit [Fusobacteriaceae bacterium]|nr:TRAP transporter fused permease subunit [Fusobacteriaceae bacterium]